MGIEGVSLNQLRMAQELNPVDLSAQNINPLKDEYKAVTSTSEGQKIDPDKEKEKEKNSENEKNKEEDEEETVPETLSTEKYDLTETNKYALRHDSKTDTINIVELKSKKIIQTIDANTLSKLVFHLAEAKGSLVNKSQ